MEEVAPERSAALSIPISLGIESNGFVFASGQGPYVDGEIVTDDVAEQTMKTLENVESILEDADLSMDDVVKVTAFITDADYYDEFNDAYRAYVNDPFPARSCVVTGIVHPDQKVEIEAIAER